MLFFSFSYVSFIYNCPVLCLSHLTSKIFRLLYRFIFDICIAGLLSKKNIYTTFEDQNKIRFFLQIINMSDKKTDVEHPGNCA
jgi:hypothetical protein